MQIWHDTLQLIGHYPVFGCGLGTFVSAIQQYRGPTPLALVDYVRTSDYLQLLAELGFVGFFLVDGALAALIVRDTFAAARVGNPANPPT